MPIYKDIPYFDHEKFLSKLTVDKDSGCWIANMKRKISAGKKTYAIFTIKRVNEFLAHRVSYSIFKKLDNTLMVDHICRNKICVNPDHLRQVDSITNSLENSVSIFAINKAKTHCMRGHEFTVENTKLSKNSMGRNTIIRRCRICDREKSRKRNLKIKLNKIAQRGSY